MLEEHSIDLSSLPRRLSDLPGRWLEDAGDQPAISDATGTWTYGDLTQAVEETARWLTEHGVRPGDRLMLVNENCRTLVALILAASRIDAWALIVNARVSPREVDTILKHSGARRVVLTTAASDAAASHAKNLGAHIVEAPALGGVALSPLYDTTPEPVHEEAARQVAALIYTTGTTGHPKGVMLSHRSILYIAATSSMVRRMVPEDVTYGVLPISHIFGLSSMLMGSLYAGCHVRLESRFSAEALMNALDKGITVFQGVPAMWAQLLEHAETHNQKIDAGHLRYASAGGSPLDLDLKQRVETVIGNALNNGYGLTEYSPTVSLTRPCRPQANTSCGPAIPGTQIHIADPESGVGLPSGAVGELWVKGPGTMLGYYHDAEATKAVLRDDGWLDTGDLARIDQTGSLELAGRSKELILRSGFNVYPPEVEAVLNSHPDVTQSAVVGRTVPGNEEVVAFVQLRPAAQPGLGNIAAFAADRLAPYKKPSEIIVLTEFPAGSTGKILKNRLKDMAAERNEKPRNPAKPEPKSEGHS